MAVGQFKQGIAAGRLSPAEYAENFDDLHPPLDHHEALVESDRCYFCYDAPCMNACPTSIDIPLFIRQISTGNPIGSAKTIFDQNILGGMCARVCPTETLCEEVCVREVAEGKPVQIGRLQRYATDVAMAEHKQFYPRAESTGKSVAVVGAGPAGLSAAVSAAERGFAVTLFEKAPELGGQFRLAMAVPGKEDFAETLRYYRRRLEVLGVDVRLGTEATAADLTAYDEVVVSTGVVPREVDLEGADHPKVVSYADVLSGAVTVGKRAAVIGAGGIGVDVSHFLTHDPADTVEDWMQHWGVGDSAVHPGGVTEKKPRTPVREVYLLQRKTTPVGKGLGKTSGWAHRTVLKDSGVQMIPGVTYDRVDDDGLHITETGPDGTGTARVLDVDHVVVCAGQESVRGVYDELAGRDGVHLIGGADVAAELDAKRAISQGTRLAAAL